MLPPEMSFDEAVFIEPVACALRGQRIAGIKPGSSVLVLGSGISGLLHIALARALGAGGTILFFAPLGPKAELTIPVNDFWKKGVTLVPSYGNSPLDAQMAIELISSGRLNVKDMITHRLTLDQIAQGFKLVASAKESIKVVIKP